MHAPWSYIARCAFTYVRARVHYRMGTHAHAANWWVGSRNAVCDSASFSLSNAIVLVKNIAIFVFRALVVLKPLVLLISRLVACSGRISVDRHTYHVLSTVTLAAHARRGLGRSTQRRFISRLCPRIRPIPRCLAAKCVHCSVSAFFS